jgi:hypothetical protein
LADVVEQAESRAGQNLQLKNMFCRCERRLLIPTGTLNSTPIINRDSAQGASRLRFAAKGVPQARLASGKTGLVRVVVPDLGPISRVIPILVEAVGRLAQPASARSSLRQRTLQMQQRLPTKLRASR